MKSILLTAFTFLILFGCNIQDPPDVEIILKDSIDAAVTVELESQMVSPFNNNFFWTTYSISNNLNKLLDSVKVTFMGTTNPTIYSFAPMLANEKVFVNISYSVSAQIRITTEWW